MPLSPMPCGQDRFSSRASAPEACGTRGRGRKGTALLGSRRLPRHTARACGRRQPRCSLRDGTGRDGGLWPRRAGPAPMRASRTAVTDTQGGSPRALAAPGLRVSDVHNPRLTGHILHRKRAAQAWLRGDRRGVSSALPAAVPAARTALLTGSHLPPGEAPRATCKGRRRRLPEGAPGNVFLTECQFYHIFKKCPCTEPGSTSDTVLA